MLRSNGSVLLDHESIEAELKMHHAKCLKEYIGSLTSEFEPRLWNDSFGEHDLVLDVSDEMVAANIRKL